jgi:hypothetical protein
MKKYFLALAVGSFVLLSGVHAQQQGGRPKMDPQAQTDKMVTDLGLNDDQKAKVLAVNTDASKKMEAIPASEDKEARRTDRKKIEADRDAALKGILTPDQFAKYTQMREDARKQHQGGGH